MRKQALLSVSDKTGVVEFARELAALGYHLLSTGGTAKLIAQAGIEVQEVADYTGFPEMLDGRVKTLNPKIHAGILARRPDPAHMKALADHNIDPIDIIVVNLYPFEATIAKPDCTFEEAIENIDIGGPTMIRAAAKNHESVAVVVDPADYSSVLEELKQKGEVTAETRLRLAKKVFCHTARYDAMISNYLTALDEDKQKKDFPESFTRQFVKVQDMRYGENPHQKAAFYKEADVKCACIATAKQLQGKELSYNNIADTDAAIECVREFDKPCCVIVKHANPCGVALGQTLVEAYDNAFACDPESAFGGIIAFNRTLDKDAAKAIIDRQFCEVIVAPHVTEEAKEEVARKKNIRLLEIGDLSISPKRMDFKRVNGGLLVQEADTETVMREDLKVVTKRAPTDDELEELFFAWKVCKYTKSNAIVYTNNKRTLGIGCGQTSRVFSARIACLRAEDAKLSLEGAALASDAFFPFRDGVDAAAAAGIKCIIQPGGSIRDEEVIKAADEHGIAMVFTGMRHFRH